MAGKYYHPNFFNESDPTGGAKHRKRLKLVQDNIREGSLLDVGCANGLFCFAFRETHNPIMGVDYSQERIDSCYERSLQNNVSGIQFICSDVLSDEFNEMLDRGWDTVIYLSIHQHMIANLGFEKANEFLRRLSENCTDMFFDMGQKNENLANNPWWHMLPEGDVREWMSKYLHENTRYTNIQVIGEVNRLMWYMNGTAVIGPI